MNASHPVLNLDIHSVINHTKNNLNTGIHRKNHQVIRRYHMYTAMQTATVCHRLIPTMPLQPYRMIFLYLITPMRHS